MSDTLIVVLRISIAAMCCELVYRLFTRSARIVPRVLALLMAAGAMYLVVPEFAAGGVETRASIDETVSIVFCYFAMLLGMMAEYGYAQAERGHKKFEFDPMSFLMPIFASPIVFIPLLTLAADVTGGGAFTRAKVMVYLVAFQNGFFWKSFFEQRRTHVQTVGQTGAAAV